MELTKSSTYFCTAFLIADMFLIFIAEAFESTDNRKRCTLAKSAQSHVLNHICKLFQLIQIGQKQIQQSLRELDFPCTKIVIAQRISTTKTADKIIVLQNGYIEEMGTHEELMEKKGYYYELVKLQTGVDEL